MHVARHVNNGLCGTRDVADEKSTGNRSLCDSSPDVGKCATDLGETTAAESGETHLQVVVTHTMGSTDWSDEVEQQELTVRKHVNLNGLVEVFEFHVLDDAFCTQHTPANTRKNVAVKSITFPMFSKVCNPTVTVLEAGTVRPRQRRCLRRVQRRSYVNCTTSFRLSDGKYDSGHSSAARMRTSGSSKTRGACDKNWMPNTARVQNAKDKIQAEMEKLKGVARQFSIQVRGNGHVAS